MRFLTIVGDLDIGGTQRAAQNYTMGYRQAGHDAAVLTIRGGGLRAKQLLEAGVPVWSADVEAGAEIEIAKKWRPDIIHIHRRGLADRRSVDILQKLKTPDNRIIETNVFSRVDYSSGGQLIDIHMQLSMWCLWKWRRWSNQLNPRPIGVVMPYLIDCSVFYPAASDDRTGFRIKNKIPIDAVVIGRVGQRSPPKWHPIIFQAFKRVAVSNSRIYLLLVGLPTEFSSYLEALPEELKKRVVQIPELLSDQELRVCYSSIDVFLHASAIGESFGMVLVEAMLCGCPVITLSTPHKDNSQLEIVGHGRGGLVAADVQGMIEALESLTKDSKLRRDLGESGAKWARAHVDLRRGIGRLVKIAGIALSCATRSVLADKLSRIPEFVTDVNDSDIRALLRMSLGSYSYRTLLLMRLMHNYQLYRVYSKLLK